MVKFKDLAGLKFNRLTVIKQGGKNNSGNITWICQCDCGNETTSVGSKLINGEKKSCGCIRVKNDLANKTFGRWYVIQYDKKGKWLCQCSCEEKTIRSVRADQLKSGKSKSCGCYHRDWMSINKIHKKYNEYDLTGEYGVGYTNKGEEFYFDLEDYDKIKDYCWCFNAYNYVTTHCNNKTLAMAHFVFNYKASEEYELDHKNRIRHDNRKENLRIAERSENRANSKLISTNSSGYKGVCFDKKTNKWSAEIHWKNKKIWLGSYNKIEDAIKIRQESELKYFGEFANTSLHIDT